MGPVTTAVGIIIGKTGQWRWMIWLGWLVATIGMSLLILLEASTPNAEWISFAIVSGTGGGILYSALSFAIQASSSNKDLPLAAALYSFLRYLGQVLGVVLSGVVFQNQMKQLLLKHREFAKSAAAISKNALGLVDTIKKMRGTGVKTALVTAYVDALQCVWSVLTALAGAALILSILFTQEKSLERELETEQGFIHS